MNLEKLKNLINKLKTLIYKKKFFFIALTMALLLIFFVGYSYYFVSVSRQKAEQIKQLEEELQFLKALPSPAVPSDELFTPGVVGEQEQQEQAAELPAIIPNTTGVVQEILQDRIIVLGDGGNFEDRQPRQLTVLFTLETNLFLADRTRFRGLAGLKQLRPGMQILINSVENLRGRTEFRALNINVLEF